MAVMLALGVSAWVGAASTDGATRREFLIAEKRVSFFWDEARRIGVSSACRVADFSSCQALRALQRAKPGHLPGAQGSGGVNPGAWVCRKLGGRVVLGRDSDQNENAFCRFDDDSFVDCGSLHWWARQGSP